MGIVGLTLIFRVYRRPICKQSAWIGYTKLDRKNRVLVKQINSTGLSKESDNRTPEEQELLKLRKENQRLKMENDVLKQAALIFA